MCMFSGEVKQGELYLKTSVILVLALYEQVSSFPHSILCHVFNIFVVLLVLSLFKMATKHSTEVWASVSKHKKARCVSYGENVCVR